MAIHTPTILGLTTIVWGTRLATADMVARSTWAGATVESIAITPKNAAPIAEIENGNGAAIAEVLLDDGFDAKVTCLYDTAKTWPALGDTITLRVPNYAGGAVAHIDTLLLCFVAGNHEISLARKKEATITLNLRYRPGIACADDSAPVEPPA